MDLEITTSRSTPMKSQVTTDPNRLILDFPQALLGPGVHSQLINRGEVKGFRVGLFGQKPPVTRVVIDLNSALPYRIYPSGNTIIVKLMAGDKGAGGHLNDVSYTPPIPAKPAPVLKVEFTNGRLSILAHDVSLSRVLNEIQNKTGADVTVPPIASQEQVVADTGALPIRDALTALLNGSRFNFILVGADDDPSKVKKVILTFRSGGVSQPAIAPPRLRLSQNRQSKTRLSRNLLHLTSLSPKCSLSRTAQVSRTVPHHQIIRRPSRRCEFSDALELDLI